jgi:hypothetical protein
MPNWASCNLTITGEASELDRFAEAAKGIDENGEECALLLQRLVPMPSELEGTSSPEDNPNWYDWRIENWGTKWDCAANSDGGDVQTTRLSDNALSYSFLSAWCGPDAAIPTVSAAFPSLRFHLRHSDECMDWDHTIICVGGETLESIDTNFDNPATREYWDCEPRCEGCGCDESDCECDSDGDDAADLMQAEPHGNNPDNVATALQAVGKMLALLAMPLSYEETVGLLVNLGAVCFGGVISFKYAVTGNPTLTQDIADSMHDWAKATYGKEVVV